MTGRAWDWLWWTLGVLAVYFAVTGLHAWLVQRPKFRDDAERAERRRRREDD